MAGENAAEIDLYDNIDEDFVQDCSDVNDLYDDVVTAEKSEASSTTLCTTGFSKPLATINSSQTSRRIATYVGNLTWWTSDQDILESASSIGINDVVEIKFHENRQNGQSKGFCVVMFGSEQSVRVAMEKLPKIDIHGQRPVITNCSKQNLALFEKAAGGDGETSRSRSNEGVSNKSSNSSNEYGFTSSRSGGHSGSTVTKAPPLMATPTMPASLGFSLRNNTSLMGQATPSIRQMSNSLTSTLQQALANQSLHPGFATNQLGHLALNLPSVSGVLMTPNVPPPPLPANVSNLLPNAFNMQNAMQTTLSSGNTHVNPSFIPQPVPIPSNIPTPVPAPPGLMTLGNPGVQGASRQFDNYGRPVIHTYTPSTSGKLSESEFEDILHRNKTVSSSAINRAVQDAASGDYASAIETLVTAISLIKQSKIASDDRCRILINSLQDTLHGIESKSYGTKTSRRRRRSYSDSGSDGGNDGYGSTSIGGGGRRPRERSNRSRSRDRHDRHDRDRRRRSRDRPSGTSTSYYGSQSSLQLPGGASLPQGIPIPGAGGPATANCNSGNSSAGSDRYRESRYRH